MRFGTMSTTGVATDVAVRVGAIEDELAGSAAGAEEEGRLLGFELAGVDQGAERGLDVEGDAEGDVVPAHAANAVERSNLPMV
jgi:hypothetical protein